MKNMVWTEGAGGLDGQFLSSSEVDFYVDKVCQNSNVTYY